MPNGAQTVPYHRWLMDVYSPEYGNFIGFNQFPYVSSNSWDFNLLLDI